MFFTIQDGILLNGGYLSLKDLRHITCIYHWADSDAETDACFPCSYFENIIASHTVKSMKSGKLSEPS